MQYLCKISKMSTKTIHQIFNSAFDRAVELQNRRDAVDAQNSEDIKLKPIKLNILKDFLIPTNLFN